MGEISENWRAKIFLNRTCDRGVFKDERAGQGEISLDACEFTKSVRQAFSGRRRTDSFCVDLIALTLLRQSYYADLIGLNARHRIGATFS